jgi:WD repeat-containing protein 55
VVADHGEWPIERISIGGGHGQLSIDTEGSHSTKIGEKSTDEGQNQAFGANNTQRRWWVGSVGHEEVLRLTDLEGFFRDNENNQDSKGTLGVDTTGSSEDSDIEECEENEEQGDDSPEKTSMMANIASEDDDNEESDQESDVPQPKKRKRQIEEPMVATKKKKEKNVAAVERSFFDEL